MPVRPEPSSNNVPGSGVVPPVGGVWPKVPDPTLENPIGGSPGSPAILASVQLPVTTELHERGEESWRSMIVEPLPMPTSAPLPANVTSPARNTPKLVSVIPVQSIFPDTPPLNPDAETFAAKASELAAILQVSTPFDAVLRNEAVKESPVSE